MTRGQAHAAPFDDPDLPSAERLVAAPVADVFAAVNAVDDWPRWFEPVVASVGVRDDRTFEVSAHRDGRSATHVVVVSARGPVHSLNIDIDDSWRVYIRTRPHPSGTHVGVVAEPLRKPTLRSRLSRRASPSARSARLRSFLDQLANHVENDA
jgi:Polyketide cyclase / dehydrase and lipid transport